MSDLAVRDQGRQSITHDRQSESAEPLMRTSAELERQLLHVTPSVFRWTQSSGESAHRQDGGRKSSIVSVAPNNGRNKLGGFQAPGGFL
jgi:hypothetical protein